MIVLFFIGIVALCIGVIVYSLGDDRALDGYSCGSGDNHRGDLSDGLFHEADNG